MCMQFDYDIDEMLYLTLSNEINEIEAKSALFISSVRTLKECFGERNIRQRAKSDKKKGRRNDVVNFLSKSLSSSYWQRNKPRGRERIEKDSLFNETARTYRRNRSLEHPPVPWNFVSRRFTWYYEQCNFPIFHSLDTWINSTLNIISRSGDYSLFDQAEWNNILHSNCIVTVPPMY